MASNRPRGEDRTGRRWAGRLLRQRPSEFSASPFEAALAERAAAAAADAFLARAIRASAVIVTRLRLPPSFPPRAPSVRKYSRTSGGSFPSEAIPHLNPVMVTETRAKTIDT